MCFSGTMSFSFAACGVLVAIIAWLKLSALGGSARSGAPRFVIGVLYFVLMEALQGVQYWYIDEIDAKGRSCSARNARLTIVGFAHICFQPYFTHLMLGAFYHPKGTRGIQNAFTLRLCLLAGFAFFMRYVLAVHIQPSSYIPLPEGCPNTEWIRASSTSPAGTDSSCTYQGRYHLAWYARQLPQTLPSRRRWPMLTIASPVCTSNACDLHPRLYGAAAQRRSHLTACAIHHHEI